MNKILLGVVLTMASLFLQADDVVGIYVGLDTLHFEAYDADKDERVQTYNENNNIIGLTYKNFSYTTLRNSFYDPSNMVLYHHQYWERGAIELRNIYGIADGYEYHEYDYKGIIPIFGTEVRATYDGMHVHIATANLSFITVGISWDITETFD